MQRYSLNVRAVGPDLPPAEFNAAQPSNRAAMMLRTVTPDDGKEHLTVLALDTRGDVLGYEEISSGTVDACMLYPRDIFAWALQVPLTRFVAIAHNHPSGKVDLSPQDKVGSAVVAQVGKLVGLDLAWSMVYTHRGPQWEVWQPEGVPQPGDEDAQPQQPKMPEDMERPEPEDGDGDEDTPEDGGQDAPEDAPDAPEDARQPEDGSEDEPGEDDAPEGMPGGQVPNVTPEVELDAVRAALRRVIGK